MMGLKSIRDWGSKKGESNRVYTIIKRRSRIKVGELVIEAEKTGVSKAELKSILSSLMGAGKVYKPSRGVLECVEY